jgi:5-hydroxyisourate hydrolase-like protein (transthyretin family)
MQTPFTFLCTLVLSLTMMLPGYVQAQTGTVTARVWDDQNGDGVQNSGESGKNIVGATVQLINAATNTAVAPDETTDGSGLATFTGVPTGVNLKLKFVLPADHAFTGRNKGGDDNKDSDAKGDGTTDAFSVASGTTVSKHDAGMWSPGEVQARVWDDQNGDGIQNSGESSKNISGVLVKLLETDGTQVKDNNGVNVEATTDANGIATLSYVPANRQVKLEFGNLADHARTGRNKGGDDNKDSDAKGDGTTDAFQANRGNQTHTKHDAGLWSPGKVLARVWDDQNGDGIQNSGESSKNISGVLVKLLETNGTQVKDDNGANVEATTDANGIATLSYVPANRQVKLEFENLADHARTGRNKGGDDNKDSDAKGDGTTDAFQANRGNQTHSKHDAGLWSPGKVLARVWDDQNGDGIQNSGESSKNISGVLVKLLETDGTQVKDDNGANVEATTDANGIATLSYVPADRQVKLEFGNLADHARTGRNKGGDDNKDSDAKGDGTTDAFQANRGNQTHSKHDAGLWSPGKVLARVWDDQNGDGKQNSGESGKNISGVLVKLIETNGNQVQDNNGVDVKAITDGNGIATLSYVPANRPVKLEFGNLPDHARTGRNKGNDDNKDSDAKGDGTTDAFQANRGNQTHSKHDAGLWSPGKAYARVWMDTNNDGKQNSGENKPNNNVFGFKVSLIETNGNPVLKNGNPVFAFTACGTGVATIGYVPADRPVKLKFEKLSDATFAQRNKGTDDNKDSDAKGDGTTDVFQANRGNQSHTKHDAGLTNRGTWDNAAIESFVWDDIDADGNQSGEGGKGIANVKVRLTDTGGNTCYCDKTDASGKVTLPAIAGTQYRLKFDRPADHRFTPKSGGITNTNNSDANTTTGITDKFTPLAGQIIKYIDAGLWAPGTLETFVWDDIDADGNQSGEGGKGIPGVTVHLTETDGTILDTKTTGSGGKATFGYVPADRQLRLKYIRPADHRFTIKSGGVSNTNNSDANTTTGVTDKFQVAKGSHNITYVDAGLWAPGTLETFVWDDIDADGNQSGEGGKGIPGVTVHLTETDGTILDTETTGSGGKATFGYVPADRQLRLKYVRPADHRFTIKSSGVSNTNNSDANTTTGVTDKFQVAKGSHKITYVDAGLWAPGTLETFVWDDIDADGNQSGEGGKGIPNVTVHLTETNGAILDTKTTGPDGKATFAYVPADRQLRLKYVRPADHRFTTKSGGIGNTNNSDANTTTGVTDKFQVAKGSHNITYVDAGLWAPGTLETFVWDDIDADGNQSGEGGKGIMGVQVDLTETNGSLLSTAYTNMDGKASFAYVPADRQLRLKYHLPADHKFTSKTGGIGNTNNSDANTTTGVTDKFQVAKGSHNITYVDAGLWKPGTLEAFVWQDIDNDGNQSGEGGLGVTGVTVKLLESNSTPVVYPAGHPKAGQEVSAITSCTDGKALLDYVPANRQLRVKFEGTGIQFTTKTSSIGNTNNSDPNTSTGITDKFSVAKGSHKITYVDAGLNNTGSLGMMINMHPCVNDQDLTWLDQNSSAAGTQVEIEASMTNTSRTLRVNATTCSSNGQQGFLGTFSRSTCDGYHAKFKINNIVKVGDGVHIELEVTENTADTYTGSKACKIDFRNDYPVGTIIVVSLEFYSPTGTPIAVVGCPNNNLPGLRDMYVISKTLPVSPPSKVALDNGPSLSVYPNPATNFTIISYDIPESSNVDLVIHDLTGKEVARLLSEENKAAGEHKVKWDVRGVPAGTYVCRLTLGNTVKVKRIIVSH